VPVSQLVFKKREGNGYSYHAFLCVDVELCTIVVSLMVGERGTTGIREAYVSALLLTEEGRLTLPKNLAPSGGTPIEGWFVDPYDKSYAGPVLRSIADDEEFDEHMPMHPLSRLRRTLRDLRAGMRLVG